MKLIKPFTSNFNYSFLLVYWLVVIVPFLVYLNIWNAGRVFDFTGFVSKNSESTLIEALHSFDYQVFQPFLHVFNWLFYKLFGKAGLPYFILFHSLYAIGVYFWMRFFEIWLRIHNFKRPQILRILLFTFLLIGLSPFNTEIFVYKVCQSYLISFICLGGYLWNLSRLLVKPGKFSISLLIILLLIQCWTFDYILIYLPITIFILFSNWNHFKKVVNLSTFWIILIINVFVVVIYFLELWLIKGNWVGHYGASVHLNMDVFDMANVLKNYFLKHLGFIHFLDFELRSKFYGDNLVYLMFFLIMIIGVLSVSIYQYYKNKAISIGIQTFWLSTICLLPVSTLSFQYLMLTENDRYGFIFSIFLSVSLVIFLFKIRIAYLRLSVLTALVVVNGFFMVNMNQIWKDNQVIISSAISNIPIHFYNPNSEIYFLNLPDNIKGTFLFRELNSQQDIFRSTYESHSNERLLASMKVVAQINLVHPLNGVTASISDNLIAIEMDQWGPWFWRNGQGAINYENEIYKFKLKGKGYLLKLNESYDWENAYFYFWNDLEWHYLRYNDQ